MSYNFRFDEKFVSEFYDKKIQYKKLEEELCEMTSFIKSKMESEVMMFTSTSKYNLYIEPCYKPNNKFINLLEYNNLHELIEKKCSIRNFEKGCEILQIDNPNQYRELWYKKLYVNKK